MLSHSALKDKAALAELLRSLLHLELGDSAAARYWGESALEKVKRPEISSGRYLAEFVVGRVRESQNDLMGARQYYERAKTALESCADYRQREGIRFPLSKDRDTLYRHLLSVTQHLPGSALPRARG